MKLQEISDEIQTNHTQQIALIMKMGRQGSSQDIEDLDDLLEEPMDKPEEIVLLSEKIATDRSFKKKMVSDLVSALFDCPYYLS